MLIILRGMSKLEEENNVQAMSLGSQTQSVGAPLAVRAPEDLRILRVMGQICVICRCQLA